MCRILCLGLQMRESMDLMYAKFMNLNALRMEAPRGSDYLFERCDEEGILLMVGWCCCSAWEQWKNWTPHTGDVAEDKLERPDPSFTQSPLCFYMVVWKR